MPILREKSTAWQAPAQEYLARLGSAEYKNGMAGHRRRKRKPKTYRHQPSDYQLDLVKLLGNNDEESFKALKMLQGYSSALGF